MANVKAIPEGFHTITPHLVIRDAEKAIEFYGKAFGAETKSVHKTPDGKIMHASLKIGNSILFLADEFPSWHVLSPLSLNGSPVVLHIYTDDVDGVFQRAVNAGATVSMPVADQFWGDRYGKLKDPFGHEWSIGTHKEDLSEEEVIERGKRAFEQMGQK
ncbi:VOC family protein [bacterium]|nr:VOC family protein [bacterium]